MNQLYKVACNTMRNLFSKRLGLVIFFFGLMGLIKAQNVTVQGTVGGPTSFATLKAAFDGINAGTFTGVITVTVTGNTTETATAQLNPGTVAPANWSSMSIKPSGGARTITGNISTALVKLLGSDNVTIDGDITGVRSLSFVNTSSTTTSGVVWIGSSSSTDGANNNTIKNCIVTGSGATSTLVGIAQTSGTTLGGVAENQNSNNTYQNNQVSLCQFGIGIQGPAAGNEDNTTNINSNNINTLGRAGIFIASQKNVLVSNNIISGVNSNLGNFTIQNSGILVTGTMVNGLIEKNDISNVQIASFWGCNGIQLSCTSTSSNLVIANNFIYNIAAGGFGSFDSVDDNGTGIAVDTGGGYIIEYNSIHLSTNQPSGGITAAIWFSSSIPAGGVTLKNNILSNQQTSSARYSIYTNTSNGNLFASINNNDYYTAQNVGFMTSVRASLANWQAVSGGDLASVSINPFFQNPVSPWNLHLAGNSPLDAIATPIAGITTDIDGDTRNATNPDIGADEFTPPNCSGSNGGTAVASVTDICASGSAILSASGYSFGAGIGYQWQWASNIVGPFNDLGGQTNPLSGLTGIINATTYYRLKVTCSFTASTGFSNVITVTVNNPAVTSPTGNTRCGVGTTTLTASGTNLQWYAAASGGVPIGTGSPFTTPVINTTTTFYVTASSPGVNCTAGKSSTTGPDGGYNGTDAGLVFDAVQPFTLLSVKMYPQAAGTVTIQALKNDGSLIAQTNYTFTGATSTGVVVPLSFTIPAGTSHRLIISANSSSIAIWRDFSGNSFPYPICTVGTITNGWISGTIGTYYFFYDWQTTTSCESTRTPVTATVTAPPAITTITPANNTQICQGASVTLSGSGGGYTTYTWNPGNIANGTSVTPTVTTTYTLTGNIPGGCRNDIPITVIVKSTPSALTVNPTSASVCPNTPTQITSTGGTIPGQSVYSNTADGASPFGFTLTNVGSSNVNVAQNTTYVQQGTGAIWLTHGDFSDGAIQSPNIPLTGFTSPTLSFYHIAGLEASTTNHYDVGYVEYALTASPVETDWVKFPASTVSSNPGQALVGGVAGFDNTSYPDWDAQFSSGTSTPGVAPATSMWKQERIDLTTWQGQPNFRIRFHVVTDVSIQYYGWLIDSINIKGTGQAPITWSPITNLYTNALGTVPYVAGTNYPVVYFNTAAAVPATTYTATATNGTCTSTATTTMSASSLTASVSIAGNPPGTICGGTCVTFTATPVNGGAPPAYQWFVNNISQGPSTVGANTFTSCTLANGDQVKCQMSVNPNVGSCIVATVVTSNIITMVVSPKPTATPITGGTTVCNGSTTTLTETPVGIVTNYEWILNGSTVQNGPAATYGATLPGAYQVIVTTNLGCKDTSALLNVTLPTYTITATAGPNGTISPSGAVVVNCGSSQVFTITPNPGYSIQDVLVNGVSVGPVNTYTFTNVTGDSTISATFFVAGCATPATSNAGTGGSVCGTSNFALAGAIGGSASTGTWTSTGSGTFNPGNVYTAASYTPSLADVGTTVTLTLTTDDPPGSCPASSSSITVIVKETPTVVVGGKIGVCAAPGLTTTILVADTSTTTINVTGFHWYHPFPTTIGTNNDSLNVASGATGSYTIVVDGANGCTATATVNVNTFPNPTVIASGTGPICTNSSVDINATATVSGSGAAIVPNGYQWYVGGSPLGGANLSILSASSAGNYQVTASDANGCISALSTPVVSLAMDNSPLNGFYTIGVGPASCTNYISFAAAIRDLNTRGISGNCIFSTPAGYTETVPSKGLKLGSALLNSNTSTGKTITFSKSGVGANPKLTAFTGGTGASNTTYPDGVWALRGVDNVTIFQIDIAENASNTTSGPQMEYGIGLFKFSSSDGAQNNTIQECNITLNKANATNASPANTNFFPDGATGIVIVNAVDTTVSTQFIPTSANATNSNNKFYGNTISNVHGGIALMGYTAPSPYTLADTNNDIGGTTGTSGNTIVNYGNSGDGVAAIGIRLYNQWGSNASYNTIRNNIYDGNGSNTVNDLRGIRGEASAGASVTYSNNAITLSSGGTGGQNVSGIDNAIGAGGTTNSVIITSNTIIDSSFVTATAAVLTGIINSASVGTLNISNNTLKDCFVNGTGNLTGISNTGTIANSHTMNGNLITNIKKNGSGTLTYLAFGATSGTIPVDASISNNTISNNVVTGGGTNVTMNLVTGGTALYNFDGNTIYNNSITGLTGTAVGTINGFGNAASPTKETINNNIFRKLFITGTSTGVHLIQVIRNVTVAGAVRVVSRNQIDSIYSNAGSTVQITGIINGVGGNVSIFKNKIHSLWPGQNGAGASFAKGITHNTVSGTPTVKIYNNIISLDLSQAAAPAGNGVLTGATAVSGFEVLTTSNSAATINFYYNTIRLAGSGTGTFGSSGIFLANTGPSVDMRNNIVSNYMTPGSGYVVALRRITTSMNGYAATSNNNLWYTTQTASTPISWDGAVAYNTLALFKAALTSPRENLSIGDNPAFVNTAQNDLHLDPSNNCNIDGAGTPIASYTDDYDGDTRDALLPDIGMDEFTGSGTGWTWKGLNTDWMNPSNWCGGVPTATSDVIIPAGKNNYPNITTVAGQAVARNITINLGGSITIANTGTLSNTGTWTNNGTLTNNGTIVLNGTVNQSFPGAGSGTLPAMTNLTVDNTGGATINKPLTILGVLKPKTGNIAVNDVVTLHSDASGTAMVDTLTGSFSYAGPGTFVVERFVSTSSKVGWRFLSIPTNTTQTINQAWMEGQTPGSYTGTGYGTIVVGTGGTANGFDQATTTPSMKTFVPATNSWISVPNTTSSIATTQGYMIFLRGDRAANTFGSQNATTLRTQGPIRSGNVTVSTANGNINQFISVGNPYPAPISFTSASTTKTGLQNTYYVWDPKLSTYGAYQTFTSPGFVANPGGGSYTGGHNAIESGQAFFVVASGSVTPHSITITENSKVSSNFQVARTAGNEAMFSTRLYAGIDTNRVLHDGVRVDFDNAYTNAIDDMDARKMSNVGENVGIIRDGIMLSIERRPEVVSTDTIFYQLGALKQQQYQFEFTPENLVPTLTGYLEDAYLNTSTPVAMDAVNTINFTVNADPASKAANRFRLVFRQLGPVPLSFTSITANKQDRNVLVSWRVDNELDIAQYEVERAADARSFAKIGTQLGRNTGASTQQYNLLDAQPLTGDNFYRVRSVGSNGAVKYSEIVKVNMAGDPSSITAYPNPVKEDGVVKLTLSNKPEGQYIVHIYNAKGQELYNKLINHDGGNSVYTLELNKILVAHGNYMLQVIETNKAKTTFKIVY